MSPLAGIHPVREALRAGLPLDRVMVAKGAAGPRLQELIELCRERGIPVPGPVVAGPQVAIDAPAAVAKSSGDAAD